LALSKEHLAISTWQLAQLKQIDAGWQRDRKKPVPQFFTLGSSRFLFNFGFQLLVLNFLAFDFQVLAFTS
jgi:hypothetical protein